MNIGIPRVVGISIEVTIAISNQQLFLTLPVCGLQEGVLRICPRKLFQAAFIAGITSFTDD
jgi:hypothetical protein